LVTFDEDPTKNGPVYRSRGRFRLSPTDCSPRFLGRVGLSLPYLPRSALGLALLLVWLTLDGCSTQKSKEAWTEEYHRHANVVKAIASEQKEILAVDPAASCVIPGIVLWPYMDGPWITQVNPTILTADVRAGDRIVAVNGKYVKHLGVLLLRLSRLQRGARLELTLDRNYEIHRAKTQCGDSTAVFNATKGVLEAAARGNWQDCLRLAADLSSITQLRYSWVAELKYNCNEADRLQVGRPANTLDASLAHQWARLRLQEAKEVPDGINQVRWSVIESIHWLRRHRFDHLAADLSDHLDAYSPHLW